MWCGKDAGSGWIVYATLNPCIFNSAAAAALAAIAALVVGVQAKSLRAALRLGRDRSYLWAVPGARGPLTAQALAGGALAALHALALVYFWGTGQRAPYLLFSEALLALTWAAITALVLVALRHGAFVRLAPAAWAAAAAYGVGGYSEIQFYMHGLGDSPLQRSVRLASGLTSVALALAFFVAELRKPQPSPETADALRQALLAPDGATNGDSTSADVEAGGGGRKRSRERSWVSLVGIAARYIWPTGFWLRARAAVCIVLVLALRLLNLAVPIAYKRVVDTFSAMTQMTHPPEGQPPAAFSFAEAFFPAVALYLALWFLQGGSGGGGLLSNLRSYLWIPIGQNSFRRVCLDIFTHVLHMDHSFHLHRRTGELLRIMDRGTASMQTLLGTVMFQIGPAIFDIVAAAAFMAARLKAWIAIIVFTTLGAYIPMTIWVTEWRGRFRRDLNRLDNARGARATDALLNFETVKIFGNEALERDLYASAIDAYQAVDFKLTASMNFLNIAQSAVIFVGLAAGMVVCTQGVADGSLTVGDAVLFVTLMQQLYSPLNYFGTYYRMIQNSMLDMEGVFDLLGTQAGVKDEEGAAPLRAEGAKYEVQFKDVTFQYQDGDPVLRGVSFTAPGGATTALVGATGSGKSSLLRLLLRFYDPGAGAVLIDGQPVSLLTQASLRAAVGVVPQDTVLFNDTIRYNIRYGRPDASDEEVEAAAEAACIGETIRTRFPLGYDTLVGERGLRLSGGEKQRVAFARALLKDPPILVLDEATSALDSITERRIQATLAERRRGKTVVVVAHRLSTIMDADVIVVMDRGEVVEVGAHEALVERDGGRYAEMWARQQEAGAGGAGASSSALGGAGEEESAAA